MLDRSEPEQKEKVKVKVTTAFGDQEVPVDWQVTSPEPARVCAEDELPKQEIPAQGLPAQALPPQDFLLQDTGSLESKKSDLDTKEVGAGGESNRMVPWLRLGALLVDQGIICGTSFLTICLIAFSILLVGCGFGREYSDFLVGGLLVVSALFAVFVFLAQYFLYAGIYESSSSQATPGMRIFGLYSCDLDGTALTLKQVWLRQTMQHAIVIFSGAISCALYLLISLQWGGSFLANLLPFFPLLVMFGLSLVRKDGRNLFDLLGRKIVKKKSDKGASLQSDTATGGRLRQPVNPGFAALYWRCGLGLTALTIVFSTVFSLFACLSMEQSCQHYEQQMQESSKGQAGNALAKAAATGAKPQGLASYFYLKALANESIGNREAANKNLDSAISLKDRSLFEFEKAKNLRALGQLDQAIESVTQAIVLMKKSKQNDAVCTILFGKSKQGFTFGLNGEDLTLENLLVMRGKTYLELKPGAKYFAVAKQRGREDLNAAIALVNIDVQKEPSAGLYRHRSELHELAGNVQSAIDDRKAADLRLRQEAQVKVDGVTFKAITY